MGASPEYLLHRSELVKGIPDPGTLFVNYAGQAFECGEFAKLVADVCYEYLGVRVPLSDFRRKFLFAWLADRSGNVERVAAVLWIQMASVSAALMRHKVDASSLGTNHG